MTALTIDSKKIKKMTTELYDFSQYNPNNIVFCDPVKITVPGVAFPIIKVPILCKYAKKKNGELQFDNNGFIEVEDNAYGKCAFMFPEMFSFGVSENLDLVTKNLNGYQMSVCLYAKEGATEEQLKCHNNIKRFLERAKEFLVKNRSKINKPTCNDVRDFKDLDKVVYQKLDEEGQPLADSIPTMYPKLVYYKEQTDVKTGGKKPANLATTFYNEDEVDEDGNPSQVNPLDYLSDSKQKAFKLCNVKPVIDFDSISVAPKPSLKVTIPEAFVKSIQTGQTKLLMNKKPQKVSYNRVCPIMEDVPQQKNIDEEPEVEREDENELELNDNPTPPPVEEKKKKMIKKKKSDE